MSIHEREEANRLAEDFDEKKDSKPLATSESKTLLERVALASQDPAPGERKAPYERPLPPASSFRHDEHRFEQPLYRPDHDTALRNLVSQFSPEIAENLMPYPCANPDGWIREFEMLTQIRILQVSELTKTATLLQYVRTEHRRQVLEEFSRIGRSIYDSYAFTKEVVCRTAGTFPSLMQGYFSIFTRKDNLDKSKLVSEIEQRQHE